MSFVFEQRFDPEARGQLPSSVWKAVEDAKAALGAEHLKSEVRLLKPRAPAQNRLPLDTVLDRIAMSEPAGDVMGSDTFRALFYLLFAHTLVLEALPLPSRAQPLRILHSGLHHLLLDSFLPQAFFILAQFVNQFGQGIDVDGRIFAALLLFITADPQMSVTDALGSEVVTRVNSIWTGFGHLHPDIVYLTAQYPAPKPNRRQEARAQKIQTSVQSPRGLLPFNHEIFDEELKDINVEIVSDDVLLETGNKDFMHFGRDTVFSDTQHWHNHKRAILPSYLGGADTKPIDDWARRKKLKREQQFMARMDRHAQTLTGALGIPLKRIIIPSVGKEQRKSVKSAAQDSVVRLRFLRGLIHTNCLALA
jgi:hypothetical protein